jgi:hypothetical protein
VNARAGRRQLTSVLWGCAVAGLTGSLGCLLGGMLGLAGLVAIVGCDLPYLWLRQQKSPWLLGFTSFVVKQ